MSTTLYATSGPRKNRRLVLRAGNLHIPKAADLNALAAALMIFGIFYFGFLPLTPAQAQVSLPAVACSGALNPNRVPWPGYVGTPQIFIQKNSLVSVNLPRATAHSLAVYVFDFGMMLAPRGWTCQTYSDEFEAAVAVLPTTKTTHHYGIVEVFVDGTSDAHTEQNMLDWALAYFPEIVATEAEQSSRPVAERQTYPSDVVKYSKKTLMKFITPKHRIGLGDEILDGFIYDMNLTSTTASDESVRGFLKLVPELGDPVYSPKGIDLFAMAIPEKDANQIQYIEQYAESQSY